MTQSANSNFNNSSIASQPLNSGDLPFESLSNPWGYIPTLSLYVNQEEREDTLLSQPLSNQWISIPTLFLCANQEEREDALLQEEDVESLNHGEVHECIEEVEEENEDQEVEDVDQEVEDKDKEPKGMENVHSASPEATPPKLHPNCTSTLCGVLDKKKMDSMELDESRFKTYSGLLHKLHNNRAKVGASSLRKYLGPWKFQEKLVDSQNSGWTNRVWDLGKSFINHHFGGVTTCIGAFRGLLNMNCNPLGPTKFKHWWGFNDEFKYKPP
ncbi:hypothetical protein PIB30_064479 [Stylosanthes scabra]|uniref:Uncharacterized protein n=1 Tax=Stylosanthes scabra TaxID=79078 RepID=A0ABU6QML5_9FABA|nr:hypothetical protein [Stylosanthes scabra]